jgi:hypothetical protein
MRNFFSLRFARAGTAALIAGAALLLTISMPIYAEAESISDVFLELRNRLDSIEVEIQARKRSGSPIGDLEAITANLRDTLSGMREQIAAAYPSGTPSETTDRGLSFDWIAGIIPESILSFRPKELFDWIIVGTGAVAVLAVLILLMGIFTGRKRKHKNRASAKKPAIRKVNLAPPTAKNKTIDTGPEINYGGNIGNASGDGGGGENLHSLVEHLRKLSPQPDNSNYPMSPASSINAAPFTPPPIPSAPSVNTASFTPPPMPQTSHNDYQMPPPAPPTGNVPFTPPPMPPAEPPPLILNAPEPPPPRATGEDLNGLIINAASDGLNEAEIAKLHQVSVDQVRLILRMSK